MYNNTYLSKYNSLVPIVHFLFSIPTIYMNSIIISGLPLFIISSIFYRGFNDCGMDEILKTFFK